MKGSAIGLLLFAPLAFAAAFVNDTWETAPWRLRLQGSEVLVSELPALPEGAPDASLRVFTYP